MPKPKPKPGVNPVEHTYASLPTPPPISSEIHCIAGINTTVYGLSELPSSCTQVAILWLLHPRLQTQECMQPFAANIISSWNQRSSASHRKGSKWGLIGVSFDHRNHGSRLVSPLANEAWRGGNPRHAQDMFSVYQGSGADTSVLLDHVAAYIFPHNDRRVVQNVVLGISLGAHAAWHIVMQDPRFSAAVIVIGCPDYTRMMSDRARLSKLKTYTRTNPPGSGFIGSEDFPIGLVDTVSRYDPASLLRGQLRRSHRDGPEHLNEVTDEDNERLMPWMGRCLGNKRILNLSGGSDKLVPYRHGKEFLDWLKKASRHGGWFEGGGLHLEDIVIDDCGHEVAPEMVGHMVRFVNDTIEFESDMSVDKVSSRQNKL